MMQMHHFLRYATRVTYGTLGTQGAVPQPSVTPLRNVTGDMEPAPTHKTYFTRAEVARLFEVAPNTVGRWVRKGKLPCIRTPGGRRRNPVEPILRLVQQFREGADPAGTPMGDPDSRPATTPGVSGLRNNGR